MSVIARGKVVGGKLKYYSTSETDKRALQLTAQTIKDNEGEDVYLEVHTKDEMNFQKNLSLYVEKVIIPPLFKAMQDEYLLANEAECLAVLCVMFGKKKKAKKDGSPYDIILRMKEMDSIMQAEFVSKIANLAMTKYQLKFPSAKEIQSVI